MYLKLRTSVELVLVELRTWNLGTYCVRKIYFEKSLKNEDPCSFMGYV